MLALFTKPVDPHLGVFEFRYPLKPMKAHLGTKNIAEA
jgi:hypothetical protein